MMTEKIINIDGVGEIPFKHSSKSKFLGIYVRPFAGISVSIPVGMSFKTAISIVSEKKIWLLKHLIKMKEYEKQQTIYDESSGYVTKNYKLCLKKVNRKNISVRITKGQINVAHPIELNHDSKEVQFAIRTGIERALKIEAKEYLPGRVTILAQKFEFIYNTLRLKNIKSRWGSCSRKNNINLNIHLMRLPEHLIDYVILHELVHTVHHDHSSRFWKLLNDVTGNAKTLDKELKNYRIAIY